MITWGYEPVSEETVIDIYNVMEILDRIDGVLHHELSHYISFDDDDCDIIANTLEHAKKELHKASIKALLIKNGKLEEREQQ